MPDPTLEELLAADLETVIGHLLQRFQFLTRDQLDELVGELGIVDRAFWVSRLSEVEMVEAVYDALVINAADMSLAGFVADVETLFESAGWLETDALAPWHLDTIWHTNLSTAANAANYRAQKAAMDVLPFWLLDVTMDNRTSDICSELVAPPVIFPADSAEWDYYYPPLHHRCRSVVIAISGEEMDRLGMELTDGLPMREGEDGEDEIILPAEGFGGPPQLGDTSLISDRVDAIMEAMEIA